MISAEAPVLFAKAAEIFITEISLRAWIHTEDNKRRTLQRNDIAMAITKYDQFDFLIDIVPRDELKPVKRPPTANVGGGVTLTDASGATQMQPDQVQYYLQLAQQHQAALQQQGAASQGQQIQILQPNALAQGGFTIANQQQLVQVQVPNASQGTNATQAGGDNGQINTNQATSVNQGGQIIQLQPAQSAGQQILIQGANGEVQRITLTPQMMANLQMQLQSQTTGQQLVLQTGPISQGVSSAPQYQIANAGQFLTQVVSGPSAGNATSQEGNTEQLDDPSE